MLQPTANMHVHVFSARPLFFRNTAIDTMTTRTFGRLCMARPPGCSTYMHAREDEVAHTVSPRRGSRCHKITKRGKAWRRKRDGVPTSRWWSFLIFGNERRARAIILVCRVYITYYVQAVTVRQIQVCKTYDRPWRTHAIPRDCAAPRCMMSWSLQYAGSEKNVWGPTEKEMYRWVGSENCKQQRGCTWMCHNEHDDVVEQAQPIYPLTL